MMPGRFFQCIKGIYSVSQPKMLEWRKINSWRGWNPPIRLSNSQPPPRFRNCLRQFFSYSHSLAMQYIIGFGHKAWVRTKRSFCVVAPPSTRTPKHLHLPCPRIYRTKVIRPSENNPRLLQPRKEPFSFLLQHSHCYS
jgi:hypothetical protein